MPDVCLCTVQIRNLKKKLQQIEALEARRQDSQLDPQQQAKLAQRAEVCAALQALQGGASLEEAHKAALSQRALLPSTSASCGLNRSLSTLSMDSFGSGSKSTAGKHRATASRASRQNLAEQPRQARDSDQGESEAAAGPSAGHAAEHRAVGVTDAHESDQTSAEATPSRPQPVPKAPLTPVTQLPTIANVAKQAESAPHADSAATAAAAVAMSKPSAWGSSVAASSPVASLRVSRFDTPLGHKAEGSAWCSPAGASMPSPVPLSSSMLSTPPSLGAAKKTKPARKGGLSMFLSGETVLVHTVCLTNLPQICRCCKARCLWEAIAFGVLHVYMQTRLQPASAMVIVLFAKLCVCVLSMGMHVLRSETLQPSCQSISCQLRFYVLCQPLLLTAQTCGRSNSKLTSSLLKFVK